MSFRREELEQIERAIVDFMCGKRVVSARNGDMRVQYSEMSLDDLLNLRRQIKEDAGLSGHRRTLFSTTKGVE